MSCVVIVRTCPSLLRSVDATSAVLAVVTVGIRARAHGEDREDAMRARRRHVLGLEVDRESMTTNTEGGSRSQQRQYYHDDDASSGLLSGTVLGNESQNTSKTTATTTTMTSRDRTNEFVNAIRSMQSRSAARTAAVGATMQNPRRARQLQSYSNFMMAAKNIGKNIASTYTKLEKLALCKNQAKHCISRLQIHCIKA